MREIKFRAWDKKEKRFIYLTLQPCTLSWAPPSWTSQHLLKNGNDEPEGITFNNIERWLENTGLKDCVGKEIYEGDIIKHQRRNKQYSDKAKTIYAISQVIWHDGKCHNVEETFNKRKLDKDPSCYNSEPCFTTLEISNPKSYEYGDWSDFAKCKIIGNIYENPELLTPKRKERIER